MNKNSPLIKGVATGIVMSAIALISFYTTPATATGLQYFIYLVYAVGIIWTLITYSKTPGYTRKFVDLFGQGFRCFIVVTLIMVVLIGIFSAFHPEIAEEAAVYYKKELVAKKDKTPAEVEEAVTNAKKHFTTGLISLNLFKFLFIGAAFTAAGATSLLIFRKK